MCTGNHHSSSHNSWSSNKCLMTANAPFLISCSVLFLFLFIIYSKFILNLITPRLVQVDWIFNEIARASIFPATTFLWWLGSANYVGSGILLRSLPFLTRLLWWQTSAFIEVSTSDTISLINTVLLYSLCSLFKI